MSDDFQFSRRDLSPEIGIVQMDSETGSTPVIIVNTKEPLGLAKQAIRAFRHAHAFALPLLVAAEGLRRLWLDLSTTAAVATAAVGYIALPAETLPLPRVVHDVATVRDRPPLSPVDELKKTPGNP